MYFKFYVFYNIWHYNIGVKKIQNKMIIILVTYIIVLVYYVQYV